MQTPLRLVKMFAASLLWAHLISAATPCAEPPKRPAKPLGGIASWYGNEDQGQDMANGQKFDPFKLTAASWTLPLGTKIRVVNTENGKSVVVTVTDRGPNRRLHRVLDLSQAAAQRLGYVHSGLAVVSYRPVEEAAAAVPAREANFSGAL
jgi:rare lipoprotein A